MMINLKRSNRFRHQNYASIVSLVVDVTFLKILIQNIYDYRISYILLMQNNFYKKLVDPKDSTNNIIKIYIDLCQSIQKLTKIQTNLLVHLKQFLQYKQKKINLPQQRNIKVLNEMKLFAQTLFAVQQIEKTQQISHNQAGLIINFDLISKILMNKLKQSFGIFGENINIIEKCIQRLKNNLILFCQNLSRKNIKSKKKRHKKLLSNNYKFNYVFTQLSNHSKNICNQQVNESIQIKTQSLKKCKYVQNYVKSSRATQQKQSEYKSLIKHTKYTTTCTRTPEDCYQQLKSITNKQNLDESKLSQKNKDLTKIQQNKKPQNPGKSRKYLRRDTICLSKKHESIGNNCLRRKKFVKNAIMTPDVTFFDKAQQNNEGLIQSTLNIQIQQQQIFLDKQIAQNPKEQKQIKQKSNHQKVEFKEEIQQENFQRKKDFYMSQKNLKSKKNIETSKKFFRKQKKQTTIKIYSRKPSILDQFSQNKSTQQLFEIEKNYLNKSIANRKSKNTFNKKTVMRLSSQIAAGKRNSKDLKNLVFSNNLKKTSRFNNPNSSSNKKLTRRKDSEISVLQFANDNDMENNEQKDWLKQQSTRKLFKVNDQENNLTSLGENHNLELFNQMEDFKYQISNPSNLFYKDFSAFFSIQGRIQRQNDKQLQEMLKNHKFYNLQYEFDIRCQVFNRQQTKKDKQSYRQIDVRHRTIDDNNVFGQKEMKFRHSSLQFQ